MRSVILFALLLLWVVPSTRAAFAGDAPLTDKTLVVWASPANLDQRGGSALMTRADNAYFAPESLVDGDGRHIMWAWVFDDRPSPDGYIRHLAAKASHSSPAAPT